MTSREATQAGRFIALVLRHDPGAAGLALDAEGWAPVADLLHGLNVNGHRLKRADLDKLVAEDAKGRYAFSPDGERIRASQGHSATGVRIVHAEAEPPDTLYHGTIHKVLGLVQRDGLLAMRRHHVHLSADVASAEAVGRRRAGRLLVLAVDARGMRAAGHVFRRSENGVWLADAVPPQFLSVHVPLEGEAATI